MKRAATTIIALLSAASADAQSITRARQPEVIGNYTASISRDDLYNSSGARLTKPWQIIRQDRANYHSYGVRDRAMKTIPSSSIRGIARNSKPCWLMAQCLVMLRS